MQAGIVGAVSSKPLSGQLPASDNVENNWVLDALRRRDAEKRGVLELRNDNRQHGNRSDPFRAAPDYPGVSSDSYRQRLFALETNCSISPLKVGTRFDYPAYVLPPRLTRAERCSNWYATWPEEAPSKERLEARFGSSVR